MPCAVATVKIKVKVIFSNFLTYKNFKKFYIIDPNATKESLCTPPHRELSDIIRPKQK